MYLLLLVFLMVAYVPDVAGVPVVTGFFLLLVFLDNLRFGVSWLSFVISVPGVCGRPCY